MLGFDKNRPGSFLQATLLPARASLPTAPGSAASSCELFSKRTMTPHSAAPTESQPSDGSWTVQSCPVTQPTFCPFTKQVIWPHRRGCYARTPLGGHRLRPPDTPAPASSPGPAGGAPGPPSLRQPLPPPLTDSPPYWSFVSQSSSRLVAFCVGLGCWAGRSDARRSSSGRCPAPAASGGVLASGDEV